MGQFLIFPSSCIILQLNDPHYNNKEYFIVWEEKKSSVACKFASKIQDFPIPTKL